MSCYTSIAKTIGLVFGCILMLVVSWFCLAIVPGIKAQIAGWLGLVFFGLCFIAGLLQLTRTDAQVIFDETGIHLPRTFGAIAWHDIVSLEIRSIRSTRILCIEVKDPSNYLARLSTRQRLMAQANQAIGFSPITISFNGLSPGLDAVWHYLQSTHGVQTNT